MFMQEKINNEFLTAIHDSFKKYIEVKTSRSPDKLVPLHGKIAEIVDFLLKQRDQCNHHYEVFALGAQGSFNREEYIEGLYKNKQVDITITENGNTVAGIAVKFIMRNYAQNSINYFETMLGETVNIRSKGYHYFQIVIAFDKIPYFEKGENGKIKKWETFTENNIKMYLNLNKCILPTCCVPPPHIPNKTLIYIVKLLPRIDKELIKTESDYFNYYEKYTSYCELSPVDKFWHNTPYVVFNDMSLFMDDVVNTILYKPMYTPTSF